MKKDYRNIEDLFRDSFNGYKIEPSKELWKKINFKLGFKDFFSADLRTFNIYYLTVICGLIASLTFLFSNDSALIQNKPKSSDNTVIIENQDVPTEKINNIKTNHKKKKEAISYPTEVYTQNDFKIAKGRHNSDLLPLPLKNNLKEFSEIYGDSLIDIGSIAMKPPKPLFILESKTGCTPFEINIKNQTQTAQYYEWSFGDGSKSTKINPSYTYQYPGVYTIKLKAIGIGGIAYCIIDSVIVYDGPKNKISWPYQSDIVEGERIIIMNESQNTVKFEWDFGDGTVSTQKIPEHIYQFSGKYPIVLKSWTDKNCMDSIKIADVNVIKTESFIIFPNAFCPNSDGSSDGKYSGREIHNDVFHPLVKAEITEYHLRIYTKEGALVFESNNVQIGWDGYYQNKRMPGGVYPYLATGKFEGGRGFLKKEM